jgi:formyltetrahydrofolate hydrolase
MSSSRVLAVISVVGTDQKGVVARFATYLAERGINIEDIEQRVVRGMFLMDMLVDLRDLDRDLSSLITGLLDLGKTIGMEVRVQLHAELTKLKPDGFALARYMRILPGEIVAKYPHRIINIHPSLLPFFPGAAPYKQAYDSGVRVSGCTAHFVTEQLDQGPVILQDVFRIDVGSDSLDDVKRKGIDLEARTLSEAVRMFVDDELVVVDGNVVFKPGASKFRVPTAG